MAIDFTLNRVSYKLESLYKDFPLITDEEKGNRSEEQIKDKWKSKAYSSYVVSMLGNYEIKDSYKLVTDDFNDGGIDAIFHNDEDKKLFFLQTKFSKTKSIDLAGICKFLDGVTNIINFDFKNFNNKIISRETEIEEILRDFDYKIELVIALANNQSIAPDIEERIKKFIDKLNDDQVIFSYKVIYLKDIYNHMATSQGSKKIIIDDFYLDNYGVVKKDDNNIVFYGTTSAKYIAQLREKYGNSLLEKNIRYFKSNTDVNNGIIKVLKEEPENFYLYNNGIKIIAEKVIKAPISSVDKNYVLLKLEGAHIINGAQTTGCIYDVYKTSTNNKLENVKVQIQIISLEYLDPDLGTKITRLSNTQNRIENKDFASQDPVQEQLKKDLNIEGYNYIYKQGSVEKEIVNDKTSTIDEATVALGCFCEDINISTTIKRAYGSIFDDLTKPPYKTIFYSGLSSYRLLNTVKVYQLVQQIEEKFRNNPENTNKKLISIHGNRMILHFIFQEIKEYYKEIDIKYYDFSDLNIEELYNKITEDIHQARIALFPDAYPAYIFKNISKCQEIKEYIKNKQRNL